ncbi:MAG: hypothetical protein ACKN8W_05360 [Actinomycetales bacterium]
MKRISALTLSLILGLGTVSCSSSNDAADACNELGVLINSLDQNQLETLSEFHETVDAILIHARNAAKGDAQYAQLANKIQSFASLWYAKAGNTVPTIEEVNPLKTLSNTYCNTNYSS